MFDKMAPKESYEEASQETHDLTCPKCGYIGKEKEFISPEDFQDNGSKSNTAQKGHVITISMGKLGGMKE